MLFASLCTVVAAIALGILVGSWQSHGTALLALRRQIKACPAMRDVRFAIVTTDVRLIAVQTPGAKIYRPDFGNADFRQKSAVLPHPGGQRAA